MENQKFVGYTTRTYCKINKTKSINPLAKLTYKNLQKVAKSLGIHAKLKHKILLALVISKKQGRQDIVDLILATNKKKLNHKAFSTVSDVRGKAEKSIIQESSEPQNSSVQTSNAPPNRTKSKDLNRVFEHQIIESQESSTNTGYDSGFSSFSSMFMENMDIEQDSIIAKNTLLETQTIEATVKHGEDIETDVEERDLVSVLLKYTNTL